MRKLIYGGGLPCGIKGKRLAVTHSYGSEQLEMPDSGDKEKEKIQNNQSRIVEWNIRIGPSFLERDNLKMYVMYFFLLPYTFCPPKI